MSVQPPAYANHPTAYVAPPAAHLMPPEAYAPPCSSTQPAMRTYDVPTTVYGYQAGYAASDPTYPIHMWKRPFHFFFMANTPCQHMF